MTDIDFRDKDPEDVYDATDPIKTRIDVLERVVDSLRGSRGDDRFDARRKDLLRLIANLDDEALNRRENRKLDRIREDVEGLD